MNLYATNHVDDYYKSVLDLGFDAVISSGLTRAQAVVQGRMRLAWNILTYKTFIPSHARLDYAKVMRHYYTEEDRWENVYPTILPQWDRTPRAGSKTEYVVNSTPEKFKNTVKNKAKHQQPECRKIKSSQKERHKCCTQMYAFPKNFLTYVQASLFQQDSCKKFIQHHLLRLKDLQSFFFTRQSSWNVWIGSRLKISTRFYHISYIFLCQI